MSSENKGDERPDRSGETREGYVPVGRRGWLKVGGKPGPTEVQFVTPNWHQALLAKLKEASAVKDAGEVKDAADAKGSGIQDKAAEGSTILGEDWYHHLKRIEAKKRAE
jgi:hypothetical protein